MEEVAFAFKNKVQDLSNLSKYKGRTTNGIDVVFYINNNGIGTAFPVL